ncbi:biotin--[acetyl-CoA-carboxylase] ligase [Helicobacter himalayensis]|uniref:biotin--[acetyl-CoA-carboxylase] ligase n=1 Tax=Helicobacter himalayensis TaxID=1591088 RepID=UPI003D6F1E55
MQILEYETLESTQTFLIENLKSDALQAPICVTCKIQNGGIGSRGNVWEQMPNALYFSFALPLSNLPQDLKLESASIYFGYLFKEELCKLGSNAWLKWPNDLYVGAQKIGGILSSIVADCVVCGIGLNLWSKNLENPLKYATLESSASQKLAKNVFLENYLKVVQKNQSWKQIFRFYKLEFQNNFTFSFHFKDKRLSFKDCELLEDGSIRVDSQVIYSLR